MPTVREQVLAAVHSRLDGITGGVTVFRNRDIPLTADQLPAVVLLDGTHALVERGIGMDWYRLSASIRGYVKASDPDGLGTAANALFGLICAAVGTDLTLGGVAVDVEVGEMADFAVSADDPEMPNAAFELPLFIDFWTKPSDPGTLGP